MNRATFIEVAVKQSGVSEREASSILDFYVKQGLATFNAHDGYKLRHGALLDCDTLIAASAELPS